MASLTITSYFTDAGAPKTGLSPTVTVWELDGTVAVNAQAMTEVAGGWYYYSWGSYDETKSYVFRADGGATLADFERYKSGANEIALLQTDLTFLKDIEGGRWLIDENANQMIFYKSDGSTEVARFNLFDSDGNAASTNVYERRRV